MSEWHLSADYILDNWTNEYFDLMFEKRAEALNAIHAPQEEEVKPRMLSTEEFVALTGGSYQRVKVN